MHTFSINYEESNYNSAHYYTLVSKQQFTAVMEAKVGALIYLYCCAMHIVNEGHDMHLLLGNRFQVMMYSSGNQDMTAKCMRPLQEVYTLCYYVYIAVPWDCPTVC